MTPCASERLEDRTLLASVISFARTAWSASEDANSLAVTVKRSGSINTTASAAFSTINNTAVAGQDFVEQFGAVRFNPGETTKAFSITILDDSQLEAQEFFELHLVNPVNASLGVAISSATIVDNESSGETSVFRPLDVLAEHQRTSTGGAAINTINQTGFVSGLDVSENPRDAYQSDIWYVNPLAQGSSTNPPEVLYYDLGSVQDVREVYLWTQNDNPFMGRPTNVSVSYLGANANPQFSLSGLASQAWQTGFSNEPVSANVYTGQVLRLDSTARTRYVRLTINAATAGTGGAFGFNEFAVGITSGNSSGSNGPGEVALAHSAVRVDEFSNNAAVTITRINGTQGAISVDFTTVNQSAEAISDYQATSGTVTLADGQTAATILIPINDDTINEGFESFGLSLDSVTGGAFLAQPRTAIVTIADDESSPPDNGGLLSEFNFDDRTATDTAGSSNGFFLNGARSQTDKQRGLVAEFDGLNDRILIPGDAVYDNNSRLTLAAWVRPDSFGNGDGIISSGETSSPWALQISDTGRLQFSANRNNPSGGSGGGSWKSSASIPAGTWSHVAVTYNGTVVRFYIDGELDRTVQSSLSFGSSGENIWIGTDQISSAYFDGRIDDARIYNRHLSPSLVAALMGDDPDNSFVGESVVTGLTQPTAIDFAPDGRMFIAEKSGVVRVFQNNSLRSQPFIDISGIVNNVRDRGLIGLAVHPSFPSVPYVYLSYVYDPPQTAGQPGLAGPDQAGNRVSRVSRFTANSASGFNTAVTNSEVVLLGTNSTWGQISRPDVDSTVDLTVAPSCNGGTLRDCLPVDAQSHGIGDIQFGTDGMLYVANGDGTSYGRVDPRSTRVQDINSLSGKLLRIDPITGAGKSDNPFYNGNPAANRSKVYSYGLRNPFRFAINPASGEPYIGDVGWTTWEEINVGRGANFGWPYYEGGNGQSFETGGYRDLSEAQAFYNSGASVEPAIWARTHAAGARAIVVGDFNSTNTYGSSLNGSLFFTDFGEPTIRALRLDGNGQPVTTETVAGSVGVVVSMTMGLDGYMYYVDIVGRIGRIVPGNGNSGNGNSNDFQFDIETGTLSITGTTGNDSFEFNLGSPDTIKINNIDYSVNVGTTRIQIDGAGGDDSVRVIGTSGDDFAEIYPTSLKYQSAGLIVTSTSTETITVDAGHGGSDTAYLYDSFLNDVFIGRPTNSRLSGPGYNSIARNFDEVATVALEGFDDGHMYDSSGSETYNGRDTYATLTGSDFYYIIINYDVTRAFSSSGADKAVFVDSPADDFLVAKPTYAYIRSGASYYNFISGFPELTAYSIRGGNDETQLYDSPGNDTFVGRPNSATLSGPGFSNTVESFGRVLAYANAGGIDGATFFDSPGNDLYVGRQTNAFLQGPGYFLYADRFYGTAAHSTAGGTDTAQFYDSPGNDVVTATSDTVVMIDAGRSFGNTAKSFEQTFSYSTKGGTDLAYLYDTVGNEIVVAKPEFTFMQGSSFYNYVQGFYTAAYARNGGIDSAQLYDSPMDDYFVSRSNVAFMRDVNSTYTNSVYNFDKVDAYSTRGGTDETQFYDSAGDDRVVARPGVATMFFAAQFGGSDHRAVGFNRVRAFRQRGGNDRIDQYSGLDYLFEKYGSWNVFGF